MPKNNWSVPTSPRSPYKIRDELILLSQYEGKRWDDRLQSEFGKALAKSDIFEGDVPDTPDWAGRARFGTIKFWGFAFKNDEDKLVITSAGKQLINGKREDEVFAKQFVKWQYPDNQHNGNEYPRSYFSLHPFIATLRVLERTKYLTKDEIALFLFTMTRDAQVQDSSSDILSFRNRLEKKKGRVPKKQFIFDSFKKQMLRFFKPELKALLGRQDQTTLFERDLDRLKAKNKQKTEEFINRHMRTFHDYADALIRYFRYSQIVSLKGEYVPTIQVAVPAKEKASLITQMKTRIYEYDSTNDFYLGYYGNIDAVLLPYENVRDLTKMIEATAETNRNLASRLEKFIPRPLLPTIIVPKVIPASVIELKELEGHLRDEARLLQKQLIAFELRDKKKLTEIVQEFETICKGEVIDPPTFLEWNTWRAFESLDVADRIMPYFKFSDDMQPLSPAGGNQPDLEVHYNDYILVPEVTLKSGAVQWRDEAEPVPVHVIKVKRQNPGKPTYGLFIAPKIDERTSNVFYGCRQSPDMFGDIVNVIPLTVKQFQEVVLSMAENGFSPALLCSLLNMIDHSRSQFLHLETDRGIAWVANIPPIISEWKNQFVRKTSATGS